MKELEVVRSILFDDSPHAYIDYRIADVLDALVERLSALETNEDTDQHASLAAQSLIHDRLSALEWSDSYAHYADSFGEVSQDFDKVNGRLDALEAHDKCQNCAVSPYIEAEKKPLTCCEGCAEFPCATYNKTGAVVGAVVVTNAGKPDCYREEKTCSTCTHALALDKYEDILCLRASVWQHPRFESPASTGCEYHYEREDK